MKFGEKGIQMYGIIDPWTMKMSMRHNKALVQGTVAFLL